MGFPIRKSADQSLFAAPHGLSQRTTSFIASQRQGIHRIPLRHLIALIIDAHLSAEVSRFPFKEEIASIERPVCFKHIRERCGHATPTCWLLVPEPELDVRPENDRMHFLFTMTDNTQSICTDRGTWFRTRSPRDASMIDRLVEPDGIEPTTSCLQSTRSPN